MKIALLISTALLSSLLFSGCVVGRRTVALPVSQNPGVVASKGEFAITSAEDKRHFENKPSDPSTPSIDGDVTKVSKNDLETMIGRQRNTYGHAMGDIALPSPETVRTKGIELIEEGLRRSGYTVSKSSGGANTVSADIEEFWAWANPGFVSVGFEARIRCRLTITKGEKRASFVVSGHAENRGQVARDANWQLAYTRAFDDFLTNFQAQLAREGF